MKKNDIKFEIKKISEIANGIFRIVGKVDDNSFTFIPGQFVVVSAIVDGKKINRAYSVSSVPAVLPEIELTVRRFPNGLMSEYLTSLNKGDCFYFRGPMGDFNTDRISNRYVCLVAIGCGIAPLKSLALDILFDKQDIKLDLFLGAKYSGDIPYHQDWLEWQNKKDNFRYFPCLSQSDEKGFFQGRIGKVMQENGYDFKDKDYFISGSFEMVMQMKEMLEKEAGKSANIFFENVFPTQLNKKI